MAGKMKVVRNRGGEYAIWPVGRENPLGWNDVGKTGTQQECMRHIEEVWTNMLPLSLRQRSAKLEEMKQRILRDGRR